MGTAIRLSAVIFLVLANGFFVAAEFSLVAMRRSRVEQLVAQGNPFARAVQRAVQQLDAYLAATQLGITMASIALGWIGEPALASLIEPLFAGLPETWTFIGSHALAVAVSFAIITTLHIVLGELAPKSLALQRTEGTALAVAQPLHLFLTVFHPAIHLLNGMGNLVLRLLGLRPAGGEELVHSVEELKFLVAASRRAGLLVREAEEIVERAFEIADRVAREVMVPRTQVVAIPANEPAAETARRLTEVGYSRYPVYGRDLDDILGVVTAKDVLVQIVEGRRDRPAHEYMRPAFFVPESKDVASLLREMRERQTHLAVVLDEYGGTAGIVTMEDLLEELVGEIVSEYGTERRLIQSLGPDRLVVDAAIGLEDLNELWNVKLPTEEADTLGGFVYQQLGEVPRPGQRFSYNHLEFVVLCMVGNRIGLVEVRRV